MRLSCFNTYYGLHNIEANSLSSNYGLYCLNFHETLLIRFQYSKFHSTRKLWLTHCWCGHCLWIRHCAKDILGRHLLLANRLQASTESLPEVETRWLPLLPPSDPDLKSRPIRPEKKLDCRSRNTYTDLLWSLLQLKRG